MIDFGHFALASAWIFSLYGFVVGIVGARQQNERLIKSAANSIYLCAAASVLSLCALAEAFITHDYSYVYVWQTSNNSMPVHYLVSAIWGGMDGSMLLWACIMSIFGALVVYRSKEVNRLLFQWVVPVLSGATGFFLLVVTFLTNPFRLVPSGNVLLDGTGLNPLLQNPSMMIHPPMLYTGFTGFVVPFAFCFAALLSGSLSDNWIRLTRRWTLVAWGFLTAGIVLGGNWAYIELGWGGFWAWDPVENASFLPWLTGTAYLHSVMVQERRGMLKVWNASLAVITYLLTVFGTFLTRSGVVQSVHAFAETEVGWVFLLYMGVVLASAIILIAYRWKELKPDRKLESYFSREAAFLFNNLALLGICFATFWGVMFPVLTDSIAESFPEWSASMGVRKSVVGPPFFNEVNIPFFLALIFLMAVGPLIAWRKTTVSVLVKTFAKPFLVGSLITVIFLIADSTRVLASMSFGLCVFAIAAIEAEVRRAVKVRRQLTSESLGTGIVQLVRRKPRRYGGFLVHLGIAMMAISITASSAYKLEKDITLTVGEDVTVGRYSLRLASLSEQTFDNYGAIVAHIEVLNNDSGESLTQMYPERRAYTTNEEVTTEVALRTTLREDLYIALSGLDIDANHEGELDFSKVPALFKVFVNPLQIWLWFGTLVVLFGTCVVIFQGLFLPNLSSLPQVNEEAVGGVADGV